MSSSRSTDKRKAEDDRGNDVTEVSSSDSTLTKKLRHDDNSHEQKTNLVIPDVSFLSTPNAAVSEPESSSAPSVPLRGWHHLEFDLEPAEGIALRGRFDLSILKGEVFVHGHQLRAPDGSGEPACAQPPHAHFDVASWEPATCLHAGFQRTRVRVSGPWHRASKKSHKILSFQAAPALTGDVAPPIFTYPPEWLQIAKSLTTRTTKHLRIAVCGAKGTGKSTFAKFLANTFCSVAAHHQRRQVFFMNVDVGQAELTPPGIMATHRLDECCRHQPLQSNSGVNMALCSTDEIASYYVGTVRLRTCVFLARYKRAVIAHPRSCGLAGEPRNRSTVVL